MSKSIGETFWTYSVCKVCGINYDCGRKHIYSKRHQENLKSTLKKIRIKIAEGVRNISSPEIHDEEWQKEVKFWCHFCSSEYEKHGINNNLSVCCYGLIHHLARQEHHNAARNFFKENKMKAVDIKQYSINESQLLKFMNLLPEAQEKYLKKMDFLHQKDIAHIRIVEEQRQALLHQVACQRADDEPTVANHSTINNVNYQASTSTKYNSFYKKSLKHNVTSNSIPPWLMDDDSPNSSACKVTNTSTTVIGPTQGDLLKHLEKQKKKGFNPKRVGANFNHKAFTSPNWLPSFGRVWNQGRRKQSRLQYETEKQRKYKP